MDYFYCSPENIRSSSLDIQDDELAHLVHVMRKKVGDEVRVVDGRGNAFDVRLEEITKKIARATILSSYHHHHEPSIDITLAVGILKNPSKFDFLVEKVSELGVKEIIPLQTERTIPPHAKVDRWQKLALAAMKQSGRSYLPTVRELMSFDTLLAEGQRFDRKYIAHEIPMEKKLGASSEAHQTVLALIGPEGGFSGEEIGRATAAGCIPL